MEILGAIVLFLVMYIVVPVAICAATIAALGGGERFLPGSMRDRAVARRGQHVDHR